MARWKLIIPAIVLVLAGTGAAGGLWLRKALRPVEGGRPQIFRVPPGASGAWVADGLFDSGLVRDEVAFRIGLRMWGLEAELKPGYYEMSPGMDPKAIAEKIAAGDTAKWQMTIPEGFTVEQIAERAAVHPTIDAERFASLAHSRELGEEVGLAVPEAGSLEGFLFPETYSLEYGLSERDLILVLLNQFKKQTEPLADEIAKCPLDLADVVTLASLIEREAMLAEERTTIAAVYYNRLERGMLLECDATVVYAWARRGVVKNRLLYRDLEIDSPYNTYKHAGLPPGPIASPGYGCIEAAVRPADVDYLYYVARGDGGHVFTRTFREHLAAIRRIRGR